MEWFRLTKKQFAKYTIKPDGRSAGPADSQETEDQYREGEGDDPLYPRTATPVDPGIGRHQPHLLGPELLQQSAAPPRDAGHGGRSSGSRRDWYGEAHAPGEAQPTPGVKECVLRSTRRDELDQRAETVARPLLGGGHPQKPRMECATATTKLNSVRHLINRTQIEHFAITRSQTICIFPAEHGRIKTTNTIKTRLRAEDLLQQPDQGTKIPFPGLFLYTRNMPAVMLTNICSRIGQVNGALGTVVGVVLDPTGKSSFSRKYVALT